MEKVSKYGDGSNNTELVITDKFGNVKSIFQKKITLTTTGSTGPATFVNNILNIPEYSSALTGYVPNSRQLTINGTTYDLSANRTWNVGTVTSVGISMPSAFTVASSPITSSGTIAITGAGTTAEYIDGTGTLRPFPSLTGYVPYIGATQDVDLGVHQLKADSLAISTTSTEPISIGEIVWNSIDGTFDMGLLNGVTLQAGQEMHFYAKADEAITNGDAVQFAGAQGDHLLIKKAVPSEINANPEYFVGVATQDFARNQFGYITAFGKVRDLNTLAYPEGTILYFASGGSTPGALTATEPSAPYAKIIVAAVVRSHGTQGTLLVRPHVMPKIEKLQDVNVTGVTSGQVLTYNGSIWVPTTPTTGTVTSVTASAPLSSSGGSTPNITISQASGTDDGYLSSADWSTFNNKQPAGNYITALSGEASGSGPGTASVTLNNASVTAKVLTGVNITGGSISASDSILTAFGKLQNQINGLIGSSVYQGTWNASTNTPALASGVGTRGYYYIVNVAGSTNLDGITDWNVGDWAIFDGTAWQQVDNTDSVTSVNGQTGAVSLTTDNIPEGATNLYFTQPRARQSISLTTSGSSGAATYNNGTGVFNIPNYTLSGLGGVPTSRRLEINGISYDLSADRSWSVGTVTSIATSGPITGGTITGSGTIGINQASATDDGYLSSTDWNTFNNKQNAITLTTTGTSGPATLIGSTLNIPQYQSVITNPVTGTGTANYVARWTSSSNIGIGVLYDNGTNVGIGTTNPGTRLEVSANNTYQISWIRTGISNRWSFGSDSSGTYIYNRDNSTLSTYFDNSGNVGIGTTNPSEKLEVLGNIRVQSTFFGGTIYFGSSTTDYIGYYNGDSYYRANAAHYFEGNGFYKGMWNSIGQLGIGNTSPTQLVDIGISGAQKSLRVRGTYNFDGSYLSSATSNGGAKIEFVAHTGVSTSSSYRIQHDRDQTPDLTFSYASSVSLYSDLSYSELMRLDPNANLGLGTSLMTVIGGYRTFTMDAVSGTFTEYRQGNVNHMRIGADGGRPFIYCESPNPLDFYTSGAFSMRLAANGNLGIATSTPGARLSVIESGSTLAAQFNTNSASPTSVSIELGAFSTAYSNSGTHIRAYVNHGSTLASSLAFEVNGQQEMMRINSSGYVGIGTTNPIQKLHVVGNVYANGGFIGYRNDGGIGLEVNGGDLGPGSFIAKFNDYNNTSKVVINGVGDVGIGTTTLTKYMSSAETLMSIVNSNVASLYLYSTTGHLYNMSSISNGDLFWYDVSAGTERMRLTASGNFGIGTSSPNVKFEVAGQAFVDKFQYNQGIQISGADLNDVTTAGFYAGSSLGNAPNAGWFYVTVERHSDAGWVHQLATSYGAGNTENEMYSRVRMYASTWMPWKKIAYSSDIPTATSVYDLLPNARVDYTWVGQVIDGTWVDVFTRANNVLTSGTWIVNMYVSDFSTGGAHYTYNYSGTFTWYDGGTNQSGTPAASEIALHRMGHAANNTVLYLRTTEETAADGGDGKFQITGNYSHTSNTTITFKFVKII